MAKDQRKHFLVVLLTFQCVVSKSSAMVNLTSVFTEYMKEYRDLNSPPHLRRDADDNMIPSGFCKTWIGTVVTENASWEEPHCRRCRCDADEGSVCQDPVCDIPAHTYTDSNCEQWSPDGCCCLRSTCVHGGKHYAAGDWFLLDAADPCTLCTCHPSDGLPLCQETTCPPLACVTPTSVPGQCCPLCLTGLDCKLPPLPVPANDSVKDRTPILMSASRMVTLTLDHSLVWNCTCNNPGHAADCVPFPANTGSGTHASSTSQPEKSKL